MHCFNTYFPVFIIEIPSQSWNSGRPARYFSQEATTLKQGPVVSSGCPGQGVPTFNRKANVPRYSKLLIGDSIIANLDNISNLSVVVHSGKDLRFFKKNIRSNASWIRQFNLTVVHVGTNNIEEFSASEIVDLFKSLVKEFNSCHHNGHIGISLILPRPRDENLRGEKVKLVNKAVQDWYSQEGSLFRKGLDYLHPNKLGNLKLTEILRCQLSDRQIHQRLGPLGQ